MQLAVSLVVYHSAGEISYAIFETVVHLNMRFRHLSETFVEVLKIEELKERRRQFSKAVQYHYALIK